MSPNAVYHRVSHGRYAFAALNLLVWCYAATSQATEPELGTSPTPQRSSPAVAELPVHSTLTRRLGITFVPIPDRDASLRLHSRVRSLPTILASSALPDWLAPELPKNTAQFAQPIQTLTNPAPSARPLSSRATGASSVPPATSQTAPAQPARRDPARIDPTQPARRDPTQVRPDPTQVVPMLPVPVQLDPKPLAEPPASAPPQPVRPRV